MDRRLGWLSAIAVCCLATAQAAQAGVRPLVAVMGTCSALAQNTVYPSDAQAWFDPAKQSQVVFYAHLLFPLRPLPAESGGAAQAWHPPLLTGSAGVDSVDAFYAQADWRDPQGAPVALYGLSFTARSPADYLTVNGRVYIPHTFTMTIGTKDLRVQAGQLRLPTQEGTYSVRLSVDGRDLGLALFRMLKSGQAAPAAGAPQAASPTAAGRP
ncbi:MAG TPA: hypothetical protein VK842_05140 [bacterium]|nr:hypothetical protein [bacterium]